MFLLHAEKVRLKAVHMEPITSGSIKVYTVKFEFSRDWDGLTRVATFKAGSVSRSVLLGESNECEIPWEVLVNSGVSLKVGVYGKNNNSVVLPTVWATLVRVLPGTTTGENAKPPTPDVWEQELAKKGDALDYDGQNLSLMSGGKPLSTVSITGGGGGGVTDHRLLSHREEENQHPIKAITKLSHELDMKVSADNVITALDIIKIMGV